MSQQNSGSGFSIDQTSKPNTQIQKEIEPTHQINGRAPAEILVEVNKVEMSNGFESRSDPSVRPQQPIPTSEAQQANKPSQSSNHVQQEDQQQDRPPSVPVMLAQPYHENIVIDRVQYVPQGGTQPIPVLQSQFNPEYVIAAPSDSVSYSQIHGATFNPTQAQYVSRDSTFRDQTFYTPNLALAPGGYMGQTQQAPVTQQLPSSQSPAYYPSKGPGLPPPVPGGYVHFPPQIHYSQYPQTVVHPAHYNPQPGYQQQYSQQQIQQTASAQHSPNPQRYSQELPPYPAPQPIIQPIAQNVGKTERPSRGPKPMVPPRVNSKITHESGHRKSASVDVPAAQKTAGIEGNASEEQITQDSQQQVNAGTANINQNFRIRQDGLYVDANGVPLKSETVPNSDAENAERSIYVSRLEHRKSVSADVSNSFPKRNDTVTFTFPDSNVHQDPVLHKPPLATANIVDGKQVEVNAPNFLGEQKRLDINAAMRMSPMPVLPSLSVAPKSILVSGERKSVDWSSLNPNQRIVVPQENRRSDYFEEHRRSPMTVDTKRFEEIRRSPMSFIPIRDTNAAERINQKSPNNLANQTFEKTRAELAMWAEQRQRHEIENRILQNREIYTTSPRSRNPSEERRPDSRSSMVQLDKEPRLSVASSAFQPIANITQNSIMEQRRHLRHVSADLTKHMELSRKEFDDQLLTGSVANLGTSAASTSTVNVLSRASPNICYQYPALSEAKLDTKMALSATTDFNETPSKPLEQVDHIIHSSRKSQHFLNSNKIVGKTQANAQNHSDHANERGDPQQQLMQNQHNIDFITEKLSQCERQQSDLHAKLQSLQSQSDILDKVAQFQYAHNDFQAKMQSLHLQNQIADRLNQKQLSECLSEQEQTNQLILSQCINASRQLYGQSLLPTPNPGYVTKERVSPRLQFQQPQHENSDMGDSIQIPNISQMPLPSLPQFDRSDIVTRGSQRMQSGNVNHDSIPCSQMSLASTGGMHMTGTLKKIPPEKPPRTSLIVQSPETESNRSQPAIGLKHTSKTRVSTLTCF